ncbi:WD repeat-containing protein 43 [Carex littledalei]|uniref:WD repeat-containing protein 43 n=1 Tax=Carex littledalei TaxID=544730 RepID=A0A833QFI3_9POAL|nr:WD repeat-containing protein 43 [Carex littledalei]
MASPNNRDLLTSFSPSSDFFAISSGDGRIKIWDTLKGHLQTEFVDITASDESGLLSENKRGHLSLDYTCMKWVQLESKKKRKVGASLLVLGTGSGDVLALDVSAGQLKWKVSDCHPGGVTAIAYSANGSFVYTAGADGMVCKIKAPTGMILGTFSVSSKAVSSLCFVPILIMLPFNFDTVTSTHTPPVTALDRANAEDAILPLPKLYAHDKKRKHDGLTDSTADLKPILGLEPSTTVSLPVKKGAQKITLQEEPICIEDRMRELGLLGRKIDLSSTMGIQIEKNWSMRMIRQHVNATNPDEVGPLFENLVSAWRIRSAKSSNKILEWMYCLLVYHGHHILSRKSSLKLLDDLQETIVIKSGLTQELLKLSGRLQLIRKQIDMAGEQTTRTQVDEVMGDASEEDNDDQEDEEIDEMVYGEEEDVSDMD